MIQLDRFACCVRNPFFEQRAEKGKKREKNDIYTCKGCGQKWNFKDDKWLYVTRGITLNGEVHEIELRIKPSDHTQALINASVIKPWVDRAGASSRGKKSQKD